MTPCRLLSATLVSLALAFVGQAWATSPSMIAHSVTQPGRGVAPCTVTPGAAIQTGDLLVLDYIAPPAFPGPVCASNSPVENWSCTPNPSSGIGSNTQIWWKLAGAADVAASTLTFNATSSWNVCSLYIIRGVDQSSPVGTLVPNTGTGTALSVGAVSSLPANSMVLLFENQDDANVAGFGIQTITPSGAPWTTEINFNGNSSPFSASFATVYQTGVTSTSSATATMSGSDAWTMVAMPIFAPGAAPSGSIYGTVSY